MTDQLWPADAVQRRQITSLVPYARNSRLHSVKQIEQIAASMREFGFTTPVLIDEHENIIAGHGRVLAAQLLVTSGRAAFEAVPVMIATGWSDSKKRAYVLADNKLSLNATWDNEILIAELQELMAEDYDVTLTGFDTDDLERLLPSEVGDLEANDFGDEEEGNAASGTQSMSLKFGDKVIPLSEDELDRLEDRLAQYIEERGVQYGFAGYLMDVSL